MINLLALPTYPLIVDLHLHCALTMAEILKLCSILRHFHPEEPSIEMLILEFHKTQNPQIVSRNTILGRLQELMMSIIQLPALGMLEELKIKHKDVFTKNDQMESVAQGKERNIDVVFVEKEE